MRWGEVPAVNGRNADPAVVADKMRRVREPHVRPLNDLADAEGLPHGHVPYVDADQGGVNARMLVLLDNPSTKAEAGTGSGLLSLDNNDRTARNCREAYARHGVSWQDVVHWNVAPAPVVNKNGHSSAGERNRGVRWTREVVALLDNLEIVLLLGNSAGTAGAAPASSVRTSMSPTECRIARCRGSTETVDALASRLQSRTSLSV